MNIAIYDLDKTITRRPTFTHFLLFYAWRECPYRLVALPIWLAALAGYRMGFYGRKPLKQFGIAMLMGRELPQTSLANVVTNFVDELMTENLQPGAVQQLENDRQRGNKLIIATAAPEFYANEIGARLGFDDVIATRHRNTPNGKVSYLVDGENCYGEVKRKMVEQWLGHQQLTRTECNISVYSDHPSDAALLDWADRAYLINPSKKSRNLAIAKGWTVTSFSNANFGIER